MEVIIKYQNENFTLDLPENCTITKLKKEIKTKTGIETKNQKLIFKGKSVFDSAKSKPRAKLSDVQIVDGSRCLLIATTASPKSKTKERREKRQKSGKISPEIKERYKKQNPEIIKLGPPNGAEKSSKNDLPKFPQQPFIIYDQNGNVARMSLEEYSIWIDSENGDQDRIFFQSIKEFIIDDIEGYKDEYKVVSLVLSQPDGTDEIKQMYFLPNQYTKSFKEYLSQGTKSHDIEQP